MERAFLFQNMKSYMFIWLLGIMGGASVKFFSACPANDLWAFSYWSSSTLGFWMFSTSLIVLFSDRRKTAFINTLIYIFTMFFVTEIYKALRLFRQGYTHFDSVSELVLGSLAGCLIYSAAYSLLCGALALVLWNGRKNNAAGKALRLLPMLFLLAETLALFCTVLSQHIKLFSALTDLLWLILYIVIICKYSKPLNKKSVAD